MSSRLLPIHACYSNNAAAIIGRSAAHSPQPQAPCNTALQVADLPQIRAAFVAVQCCNRALEFSCGTSIASKPVECLVLACVEALLHSISFHASLKKLQGSFFIFMHMVEPLGPDRSEDQPQLYITWFSFKQRYFACSPG